MPKHGRIAWLKVAKPVVKCPRASRSAKPGGSSCSVRPVRGEGTPAEIYQRTRLRALTR